MNLADGLSLFASGQRCDPSLENGVRTRANGQDRGQQSRPQAERDGDRIILSTITDVAGLAAVEHEWRELADQGAAQQVFQGFDWVAIWAAHFLDRRTRLAIVTGHIEGTLVLVWPLVVRHVLGCRVLVGLGEPLAQYDDALLAAGVAEPDLDAIASYVRSLPVDLVSLRRVRDDSAVSPLLARVFGAARHRAKAPYVDFTGAPDVAAFEKRFSGKVRSSRRRRRRRLEDVGALSFTPCGPSAEAAALVETSFAFKRAWAKRNGLVAPALRDPRFERCFAAAAAGSAGLRVSVLRAGDTIMGVGLAIACRDHLFGHVLAPRPDAAGLGVGGILAEHIILGALADGFTRFDLLAPEDPYKLEWTAAAVGVGDYTRPLNLRGALYDRIWLQFGRRFLKRAQAALRRVLAPRQKRDQAQKG